MFMIVSYAWPVASAHVQLPGRQATGHKPQDQPVTEPDQQRRILISAKV